METKCPESGGRARPRQRLGISGQRGRLEQNRLRCEDIKPLASLGRDNEMRFGATSKTHSDNVRFLLQLFPSAHLTATLRPVLSHKLRPPRPKQGRGRWEGCTADSLSTPELLNARRRH